MHPLHGFHNGLSTARLASPAGPPPRGPAALHHLVAKPTHRMSAMCHTAKNLRSLLHLLRGRDLVTSGSGETVSNKTLSLREVSHFTITLYMDLSLYRR